VSILDEVLRGGRRAHRAITPYSPFTDPEEEETALGSLLGMGGSALSAVGNVLDTPRAFVTGATEDLIDLTSGQEFENRGFGGIFDTDHRVSGEEFLRNRDWIDPYDDPSWIPDTGDMLGFGAEVLMDPLTYVTFGASGGLKAGEEALKSGKWAKGLAGQLKAGQRSLVGLGLPGMDPIAHLGTGKLAQKFAGGLDEAGRLASSGTIEELTRGIIPSQVSPGREFLSLFTNNPAKTPEVAAAFADVQTKSQKAREEIRRTFGEMALKQFDEITDPEQWETVLTAMKGLSEQPVWSPDYLDPVTGLSVNPFESTVAAMQALPAPMRANVKSSVDEFIRRRNAQRELAGKTGLEVGPEYGPGYARTVHRSALYAPGETVNAPRQSHLEPAIGATNTIRSAVGAAPQAVDDLAVVMPYAADDPIFRGTFELLNERKLGVIPDAVSAAKWAIPKYSQLFQQTRDEILKFQNAGLPIPPNLQAMDDIADELIGIANGTLTPPGIQSGEQLRQYLASFATDATIPVQQPLGASVLDDQAAKDALSWYETELYNQQNKYTPAQKEGQLFGRNAFEDMEHELVSREGDILQAQMAQQILGKNAKYRPGAGGLIPDHPVGEIDPDTTRIGDALKRLGYVKDGIEAADDSKNVFLGNIRDYIARAAGIDPKLVSSADVANMPVDTRLVDDLLRTAGKGTVPEWAKTIGKVFDPLLNRFKEFTLAWPARWPRDFVEAIAMVAAGGHFGARSSISAMNLVFQGQLGDNWQQIAKNPHFQKYLPAGQPVSHETVTRAVQNAMRAENVAGMGQGVHSASDLTGAVRNQPAAKAGEIVDQFVGAKPVTLADTLSQGSSWNPMATRGSRRSLFSPIDDIRQTTELRPVAVAEKIGGTVDTIPRVAAFLDMLADGYDPSEAAKRVKALLIDYSKESFGEFENEVLRRLVPFYSFARRAVPQIVSMIAEKPGGLFGQMIRATRLQEEGVAEQPGSYADITHRGMGIPVSPQHVLQGMGNPTDVLNQYLANPEDGISGQFRKMASQLRPELKLPIEMATNRQLYFDQPFDEFYGEGLGGIANAIFSSVVPRYATLAKRTAKDPLNALTSTFTGMQVEDTVAGSDRQAGARGHDLAEDRLQRGGNFRRMERYVPIPENAPYMTPEELMAARWLSTQSSEARKRKKEQAR
jgi:hypothetical protein